MISQEENTTLLYNNQYSRCNLCHRHCNVDRNSGQSSYCGMTSNLIAARAALHYWEEPCISGECGSGTVFFSGCSLRCVYCQNHKIAIGTSGKAISVSELAESFLRLQEQGAANINLVTPTHFVPSIIPAIEVARNQGLALPIVYNTGNFETLDTIRSLEGIVDVYLPDFKYWDDSYATRYSNAKGYAGYAAENIAEMFRQTGEPVFQNNFMVRGVIVRHLLLPRGIKDSKQIVKYLYETYGDSVYLSLMSQYTPLSEQLSDYPEINRKVAKPEYERLIDYALELGVKNAFIQEGDVAEESFIPSFEGEGLP